jgi:radical SAM superfamily enzyme YgiQ (UPF0313 family)
MNKRIIREYRKVLDQETDYSRKDPGGRIKIALAYPNTYYVGMSNLGFHTMYHIFNSRPDTLCERVFLPSPDLEKVYRNSSTPLLSIESQTPVREFHILAFSCSFENDYLNCLKILDLAGLPLRSSKRDEGHPIVAMGGACTFFNVEPITPFIDCFICGEGESIGNEFLDLCRAWLDSGEKRYDLFHRLLDIKGIYVPVFYDYRYDNQGKISELIIHKDAHERIQPRIENNIDLLKTSTAIYTHNSEFSNMYLLEVTRGCPRGCDFCLLSKVYKPFREKKLEGLLKLAREGLGRRDKIGLVGASLTDYRDLEGLCEGILSMGGKISLCSMRLDNLSDRLMEFLVVSGIKTITLAPEAGREQLRSSIGKADITDDKIIECIEKLVKWEIPNLKLYFMVGLPNETEEDVKAVVRLAKRIKHHAAQVSKGRGALRHITISVNSFVPKPLTRFQFYPMESVELLNKKIRYIAKEARLLRGISCTHDMPKWSYIQGLLARGDRRIGELLLLAYKEKGNWKKAFSKINLGPDFYLYREIEEGDIPPWALWVKEKFYKTKTL